MVVVVFGYHSLWPIHEECLGQQKNCKWTWTSLVDWGWWGNDSYGQIENIFTLIGLICGPSHKQCWRARWLHTEDGRVTFCPNEWWDLFSPVAQPHLNLNLNLNGRFWPWILFRKRASLFPDNFIVGFTAPTWYNIWYDMIWYDMIWYDLIWYDIFIP